MKLKLLLSNFVILPTFSYIAQRSFSKKSHLLNTQLLAKKINVFEPKSLSQQHYVDMLNDNKYKLIIANGSAGTGKTLLACQSAIKSIVDGDIDKIVITRPVVPVEEDIGFLPGTLDKKMDPWTRPIMDIFNDFHSKNNIKNMMKSNAIEISPLGFMRGRTFKNSYIIADEMQNCSPNQMMMLLTRIGDNSKVIITGDLKQCDKRDSGLGDLLTKLNIYYNDEEEKMKKDGIGIITFNNKDIQRSKIVSTILKIYEN